MAVMWEAMHGGWWAMRDRRLVGEVVWYHDEAMTVYWAGFARRERVPGSFTTEDEAKVAVEVATQTATERTATR